jgi:rRNA maturation endonuclease Nob1
MRNDAGDYGELAVDEIETVCLECFRVLPKRAPSSCPTCGGRIIRVRLGQGGQAVKEIKARGHSNLAL